MALCSSTDLSNNNKTERPFGRDEAQLRSSSELTSNSRLSTTKYNYKSISPHNVAANGFTGKQTQDKGAGTGVEPSACMEEPIELWDLSRDSDAQTQDSLKETQHDPFKRSLCRRLFCDDGIERILFAHLIFVVGVTIALVAHIYIAHPGIVGPAVVVSDSRLCTSLGLAVLRDGGSSVDAAITTTLCQGIVHPHTSGIGGGGVILLYDKRKNKSMVIDCGETAPSRLQVEMLQHDLQNKTGLLIGVPGLLKGLVDAHWLYGRLQWSDLVLRAARVARQGFNVSHSLAQALETHKVQNVSELFREMFLPQGVPPAVHSTLRLPRLASVLERIARLGVEDFYMGIVSKEIASIVKANGGVLTSDDMADYSTVQKKPLTGHYMGYSVLVPPPPSTGAALLSFLNIMEGFKVTTRDKAATNQWIAESLKAALVMASEIADPQFVSSVSSTISHTLSKQHATALQQLIRNSTLTVLPPQYTSLHNQEGGDSVSSQVIVMGSDDLIVSLSWPFGSGIITPSGILLNSQILGFSRFSDTQNMTWLNERNRIQGGKRPRSFLLPTIVRHMGGPCSWTAALGASAGSPALSGLAQILINLLSVHKNLTDSISDGRLHPNLQANALLIDARFPQRHAEALSQGGYGVQRVKELAQVSGAESRGVIMRGAVDPRCPGASAQTLPGTLSQPQKKRTP